MSIKWGLFILPLCFAAMTPKAQALWTVLSMFARWNTDKTEGTCFPGRETLADIIGCTLRSIDNAMDDLISLGIVDKISPRGKIRTTQYVLRPLASSSTAKYFHRDKTEQATTEHGLTEQGLTEHGQLNNLLTKHGLLTEHGQTTTKKGPKRYIDMTPEEQAEVDEVIAKTRELVRTAAANMRPDWRAQDDDD